MAKIDFPVRDYLRSHNAVGASEAIPCKVVASSLLGADDGAARRIIRAKVYRERKEGALICASSSSPEGYFLPSCAEDVVRQKNRMERGIKSRAIALRPFRRAVKAMAAGKEGRHG